jgi:predicted DCC family thiol-disulfide oxidoreductase YuxK
VSGAPRRLVLYDGECGFCDRSVQWLLARDPEGRLSYAPLQGPTAAGLRADLPELPRDIDTVALVEGEGAEARLYLRSDAVLRIAAALPSIPRWVQWGRVFPRPLRDLLYRAFAASRYRLFGRVDACRVPDPAVRARFLA